MKKRITSLIIILVFLFLIACNSDNDTTTVKDGTYVLEQAGAESLVAPSVRIYNDNISFSYDLPNFAEKASPVSVSVRGGDESVILKKHYLFERIFGMMLIGSFEGRDL